MSASVVDLGNFCKNNCKLQEKSNLIENLWCKFARMKNLLIAILIRYLFRSEL